MIYKFSSQFHGSELVFLLIYMLHNITKNTKKKQQQQNTATKSDA